MRSDMPADAERLLHVIDELGASTIAARAVEVDRLAINPVDSWADLRPHGLFLLKVPRRFGGLEVDQATYVAVIERLARHCAATAMTLHMHSTVCDYVAVLGVESFQRRIYETVVADGLLASWGSEPTSNPNRGYQATTTVRSDSDGYVINGTKFFCTMAGAATHAAVWCVLHDGPAPSQAENARLAMIDTSEVGLSITGTWDPLGMRGTVSPSTVCRDCRVLPEGLLGNPFTSGVTEQFAIGFAAVVLGSANGALAAVTDQLGKAAASGNSGDDPRANSLGACAARLAGAQVVLDDAARRWHSTSLPGRVQLGARAKYLVQDAALGAVNTCLELAGGRGTIRGGPIERAYRDVRTASLMPPNKDRMEQILGAWELGVGERGIFPVADDADAPSS